jgi:hypothetical protein
MMVLAHDIAMQSLLRVAHMRIMQLALVKPAAAECLWQVRCSCVLSNTEPRHT